MDYDKLEKLNKLRLSGALTDEEFEYEKRKLFDEEATASAAPVPANPLGMKEHVYLGLMSFFILIPYVGWVAPIIMWAVGKKHSEKVLLQGKYIINWFITWAIIGAIIISIWITGLLFFSIPHFTRSIAGMMGSTVGSISLLAAIEVIFIVFPIIGGVKGMKSQTWKYPLSFSFLK